jgi:Domain of unknown function (DUF6249)
MTENVFAFAMVQTFVSLAATILVVLIIAKAVERAGQRKHEAFLKVLEAGVYDRKLLKAKTRGHGSLGWGIVFTAIGVGLFIGFAVLGILKEGAIGALVPLFTGIGLIVFHSIVKRMASEEKENGEPVRLPGKPPVAMP